MTTTIPFDPLGMLPRFLSHGVIYSDFAALLRKVAHWEQWLSAWVETARDYQDLADRRGIDELTGAEALWRASVYYHYAKFLWLEDLDLYWSTLDMSVATHSAAMERLDATFERVAIPFGDGSIVANLRWPPAERRPTGLVILAPGLDSTKEEFTLWEDYFLARDLATASLDGPGQGEAGRHNPMTPRFELAVSALLDAIGAREALVGVPLGITGVGLGGHLATRAAALDKRISAVGVVGGAYEFENMPRIIKSKFMLNTHARSEADARALASEFTTSDLPGIEIPYLVIHGGRDAVMSTETAESAVSGAPLGEFYLYPSGNTSCQSVNHLLRPRLADWFVRQFGGL